MRNSDQYQAHCERIQQLAKEMAGDAEKNFGTRIDIELNLLYQAAAALAIKQMAEQFDNGYSAAFLKYHSGEEGYDREECKIRLGLIP